MMDSPTPTAIPPPLIKRSTSKGSFFGTTKEERRRSIDRGDGGRREVHDSSPRLVFESSSQSSNASLPLDLKISTTLQRSYSSPFRRCSLAHPLANSYSPIIPTSISMPLSMSIDPDSSRINRSRSHSRSPPKAIERRQSILTLSREIISLTPQQIARKQEEMRKEAAQFEADVVLTAKALQHKSNKLLTFAELKAANSRKHKTNWKRSIRFVIKSNYVKSLTEASVKTVENAAVKRRLAQIQRQSENNEPEIELELIKTNLAYVPYDSSYACERLACLHIIDEEYEIAVIYLKQAIIHRPKATSNYLLLADLHQRLFTKTRDFKHLEEARSLLSTSLKVTRVSLTSLKSFPSILYDLGRVYETYGAFEGALEMYSHVMQLFPKYPRYHNLLYRCIVISLHLASLCNNAGQKREEMLLFKAEEMLHFLIESTPDQSNLARENLVFLYARLLVKIDKCHNVTTHLKVINSTMSELFYLMQAKKQTGRMTSWLTFFKLPSVWQRLAESYAKNDEPTLAVHCYDEQIALLNLSKKSHELPIKVLLNIATEYSKFQETDLAVSYAQTAWMLNRFDEGARRLLTGWSGDYRWYFEAQVRAVRRVQRKWRTRVWSRAYYLRYKAVCIKTWEAQLIKKPYSLTTRQNLTHYARLKWRGLFLFQSSMATKIQRFYRVVTLKFYYFSGARDGHLRVLAGVYMLWRGAPFDVNVREKVRVVCRNKFTPGNHKVKRLPGLYEREDAAAQVMQNAIRSKIARTKVEVLRDAEHEKIRGVKSRMVLGLQMGTRRRTARLELTKRKTIHVHRLTSIIKLQTYARRRHDRLRLLSTLKQNAEKRKELRRAVNACIAIQALVRMYVTLQRVRSNERASVHIQRVTRGYLGRCFVWRLKDVGVRTIQRAWLRYVDGVYVKILVTRIKKKRDRDNHGDGYGNGGEISAHVRNKIKSAQTLKHFAKDARSNYQYHNPTLSKSSLSYRNLRGQRQVMYDRFESKCTNINGDDSDSEFNSVDCTLLSNLLTDPLCTIEELTLSRANLTPPIGIGIGIGIGLTSISTSLKTNKTLKHITLSNVTAPFEQGYEGLIRTLTTSNYTMQSLSLTHCGFQFGDEGGVLISVLLQDYFHLKFGELTVLGLSHDRITDVSGVLIGRALGFNQRLVSLDLSSNKLTDVSVLEIANALDEMKKKYGKSKCKLKYLNLSHNYIQTPGAVVISRVMCTNRTLQTLDVTNNLITDTACNGFRHMISSNTVLVEFKWSGNMFRDCYSKSMEVCWEDRVMMMMMLKRNEINDSDDERERERAMSSHDRVALKLKVLTSSRGGRGNKETLKRITNDASRSSYNSELFIGSNLSPRMGKFVGGRVARSWDVGSPGGGGNSGGKMNIKLDPLPSQSDSYSGHSEDGDSRQERDDDLGSGLGSSGSLSSPNSRKDVILVSRTAARKVKRSGGGITKGGVENFGTTV